MNLQQLEYIIAVDNERHFVRAAEKCFVTQATLSMMIKKLEEELDCTIFDRSKQPVVPTELGELLIAQARVVLHEHKRLADIVIESHTTLRGELKMAIIPTIAPYLLPLFLHHFLFKYPEVKISVRESTTQEIIDQLQKGTLDMGILATPLHVEGLKEQVLYYERFKVFASKGEEALLKNFLLPEDIDPHKLLLLEEGHCMRSQMLNICELQKSKMRNLNLDYEAGSIESLVNLVEVYNGVTIIPELCMSHFDKERLAQVKSFKAPEPVREVSIVTYRHFAKKRILEALASEITARVAAVLAAPQQSNVIGITV